MKATLKIITWVAAIVAYSGWTYMVATNSPPTMSKFDAWVTAPAGLLLYVGMIILIVMALIILPVGIILKWWK